MDMQLTIQHEFAHAKLKEARKRIGWTQSDLAFAMNCTPYTVQNWETGFVQPPVKRLIRLCEVLEIDVRDLFV